MQQFRAVPWGLLPDVVARLSDQASAPGAARNLFRNGASTFQENSNGAR